MGEYPGPSDPEPPDVNLSIKDLVLKFLWISPAFLEDPPCLEEQAGSLHFLYFAALDWVPGLTRLLHR